MGLGTFFTGKDRLTRKLEKLEKNIASKFFDLVAQNAAELQLSDGKSVTTTASAMSVASAINQFVTHYVRTQISIHPKWSSEGTFNEEA